MNLKEKYIKEVIPAMKKKFGIKNDLAVPKIKKVVVNIGIGQAARDKEFKKQIIADFKMITGQKPVERKARKSIAGFKVRQGMTVGLLATLRRRRMWDFIDRLINIALPRTRDFRGIPKKSFGTGGNLTIGIREQIIFSEINAENAKNIFGLEVTIVTNAQDNKQAIELLKLLGFPIQ